MILHTTSRSLLRPHLLGLGLAVFVAVAAPAVARAQDEAGALRPDEMNLEIPQLATDSTADTETDAAAAGDVALNIEQVQALQEMLRDLGYFTGPADGRKGPRTRTAVRNFQRDQGLLVSGSLDDLTVAHLQSESHLAQTPHAAEVVDSTASQLPVTTPAPETVATPQTGSPAPETVPTRPRRSGSPIVSGGRAVVSGVATGVTTGVGAVGVAGRETGKATATAGQATAKATATAGKATAKASVATYDAGVTAGKAVAGATVTAYNFTRRAIVGDRDSHGESSDDGIKKSIERQYAQEEHITPGEVDVRVSHGNVTLAMPQNATTDVDRAVRIAKLTPGVQSVTTVTTAVTDSAPAAVIDSAPPAPVEPIEPIAPPIQP